MKYTSWVFTILEQLKYSLICFYLIINNEYKSMVFTILRGCLPYSNNRNILECECTNGTYDSYSVLSLTHRFTKI